MRICLLTPTFLPRIGGAEICIDQLARNFVQRGHEPVVVAERVRNTTDEPQTNYPLVRYEPTISQRGCYLRLKKRLTRLHRQYDFQIINAHMAYPGAYVGLWFARRYGVPLVVTPHGGGVFYRSRFRSRPTVWRRIQAGLNAADAVISLSSYFDKLLAEIAPHQRHIVRIGNGVNNADFSDPDIKLNPALHRRCGKRFVLGLGRLVTRKGFDTAIIAFSQIAGDFPDLNLVFAGDGPERAKLERLAEQLQIKDRVVFLGMIVGSEKIALLRECLFTVVPSVEEDNMPLVVLESLACGKPVIGSRLGGIPDIVCDAQNGLLCPPGDPDSLAAALAKLATPAVTEKITPDLYTVAECMAPAALATARRLDWHMIAGEYLQLFDRLTTDKQ